MLGLVSIVPALVLLVACANAANVLMAHHTARRREFAMQWALGAARGRLVRDRNRSETLLPAVSP
jgi:putative ABC transport system permease protein